MTNIQTDKQEFEKSLYDVEMEKIQSAYPTDRQIVVGKVLFWCIVLFSILLMGHMVFSTGSLVVYPVFYVLIVVIISFFSVLYTGAFYMVFWEPIGAANTNNFPQTGSSWVYIYFIIYSVIFTWNFLKKHKRHMMILLAITYAVFLLPLLMATLYESTGWHMDISDYISILDIMPNVWQQTGGDLSQEMYLVVNTMYVIVFYGMCIILLFYYLFSAYEIYVWRNNFYQVLSNADTLKVLQKYAKKHPKKKTKKYGRECLYMLLAGLVFLAVGFDFGFKEFYLSPYMYEFSFVNGIYSIMHTLFFTMSGLFFGLGIPLCFRFFMEHRIYVKYF